MRVILQGQKKGKQVQIFVQWHRRRHNIHSDEAANLLDRHFDQDYVGDAVDQFLEGLEYTTNATTHRPTTDGVYISYNLAGWANRDW